MLKQFNVGLLFVKASNGMERHSVFHHPFHNFSYPILYYVYDTTSDLNVKIIIVRILVVGIFNVSVLYFLMQ